MKGELVLVSGGDDFIRKVWLDRCNAPLCGNWREACQRFPGHEGWHYTEVPSRSCFLAWETTRSGACHSWPATREEYELVITPPRRPRWWQRERGA